MKIIVTGSSGLIGNALKKEFSLNGHVVEGLLRTRAGNRPFWDIEKGIVDLGDFGYPEAVVHLAGENIAAGRWTSGRKRLIEESRVEGTRLISRFIAALPERPKVFVSSSAIGIYGNRGDEMLDEGSPPGSSWLARIGRHWEEAADIAAKAGIRTVCIRTGIVLSRKGGALKKMLTPFRMGVGGMLGNGRQYMSWVSLDDMVGAVDFILRSPNLAGPVNLVSPHPATNRSFSKTLGKVLRRPAFLPLPAFAARCIFGELADELLLGSARVVPRKLLEAGYRFRHTELEDALKDALTE